MLTSVSVSPLPHCLPQVCPFLIDSSCSSFKCCGEEVSGVPTCLCICVGIGIRLGLCTHSNRLDRKSISHANAPGWVRLGATSEESEESEEKKGMGIGLLGLCVCCVCFGLGLNWASAGADASVWAPAGSRAG